jgi:hypothetical protein
MSNWVYIQSENSPPLFTVGFYRPDGAWEAESDHGTREEAAARVNYLNGAQGAVDGLYQQFADVTGLNLDGRS